MEQYGIVVCEQVLVLADERRSSLQASGGGGVTMKCLFDSQHNGLKVSDEPTNKGIAGSLQIVVEVSVTCAEVEAMDPSQRASTISEATLEN